MEALYPRKGTVTFLVLGEICNVGLEALYPRKGTVTNSSESFQENRHEKHFIPARGRRHDHSLQSSYRTVDSVHPRKRAHS